ncbi:MAG TPA: hypothetical protein VHY08_10345 [Bacillota bacterium]|nr:hypothetical protein [Bacillota bacterium]
MKITTKIALLLVLTAGLLFSCAVMAGAEMLFGVSAETGTLDFSADISAPVAENVSETPSMIILTGDLNLLLIHINAEYGTAEMGKDSLYLAGLKAGWELGPSILKAKLYGGYRAYGFTRGITAHAFGGLVANLGVESKLGNLKIYGDTEFPLVIRYTNGITDETGAAVSYLNLGVSYAPLPLLDVFVNSRAMTANSSKADLSVTGTTLGVRFSF